MELDKGQPALAAGLLEIQGVSDLDDRLTGVLPAQVDGLIVLVRVAGGVVEHTAQGVCGLLLVGDLLHRSAALNIEDALIADLRPGGQGIRQQSHRHHDGQHHGQEDDPEGGLLVIQDGFDPLLHAHLTEGQGTGGDGAAL